MKRLSTVADINRRFFLAAAPGAATLAAACQAFAAEPQSGELKPREIRLAAAFAARDAFSAGAAKRIIERLEIASGGALLFKTEDVQDAAGAASRGEADAYFGYDESWAEAKAPGFQLFGALPFGLTAPEQDAWVEFLGGGGLWRELARPLNIMPLLAGQMPGSLGLAASRKIEDPSSFKGLRIAASGHMAKVFEKLGAQTVRLEPQAVLDAFDSGAIAAAELRLGANGKPVLSKAAKFYYWPGFLASGGAAVLGFNLGVWEKLSEAERGLIQLVCAAERMESEADRGLAEAAAIKDLAAMQIEQRKWPDAVLAALGKAANDNLTMAMGADEPSWRLEASYRQARGRLTAWAGYGEDAYAAGRRLPFAYGAPVAPAPPQAGEPESRPATPPHLQPPERI